MEKSIITIALFLCFTFTIYAATIDSIAVNVSDDTVYFDNYGVHVNCASSFMLGVYYEMYRDTIYLVEIDTMKSMADCDCYFNLSTKITGLTSGHYLLKIFRYMPYFHPESVLQIGILEFDFIGSEYPNVASDDFQSSCYYLSDVEGEMEKQNAFTVNQNYPNPFNPSTKIRYTIPSVGTSLMKFPQFVKLKVYDVLGHEIATLVDEYKPAGSYEVEFKSTVGSRQLASGVYYYQLRVGSFVQSKKMIMLK